MRRALLVALSVSALVAACGETSKQELPTEPGAAQRSSEQPAALVPGTCTDKATIAALINEAFGKGSPNARSALGKLDNLDRQVKKGNFAEAKAQAFNLVDFVLLKYEQGGFPGTADQFAELARLVFCYAGLAFDVEDPAGAAIIYPEDAEQVVTSGDQLAGVELPPNPVSEPTLVTVTKIDPATFPAPGAGPLITKLDQYPGFYHFKKFSDTDAPLTEPVVVGVCPGAGIPTEVLARLRLGHQKSSGFEITPPANVDFLDCSSSTASTGLGAFVRSVASIFLPRDLHAATMIGGGVGGLASEFSDFGPVDTHLSFGGGVGGLPSEFIRMDGSSLTGCSDGVEAPVGSQVPMLCRPSVTVTTHLGTLLTGVPVTFSVELGGGVVAPEMAGSCGTFGSFAVASTNASATARACWTLGAAPGLNQVRAVPAVGGDAPAGVTFAPAAFIFTATANPPVAVRFIEQPPEGANIAAGSAMPLSVAVVDKNGMTVEGWSGVVVLTLNQHYFANGSSVLQQNVEGGFKSFAGLSITHVANGYRMKIEALLPDARVSQSGNLFNVVP